MKHMNSFLVIAAALLLVAGCIPAPTPTLMPTPTPLAPEVAPTAAPYPLAEEVTARVAPGSVLVRYVPGTPAEARDEARTMANGKADKQYKLVPGLEKLSVSNVPAALQSLTRLPYVMYAEPDYVVTVDEPRQAAPGRAPSAVNPDTVPNDPLYPNLWGMASIDAPLAWDTTQGTPAFVVAVIDTGIDYTHPDLAANIWTNPAEVAANGVDDDGNGYVDDVHGYDFANNDGDPMDDYFHGTHVAGTIGAVGNNGAGVAGVNWRVKLMPVKFLDASGSGLVSGAISGLEYAVKNGARVSNNSWGGSGYSQALYDAIKNAQTLGHLFVAAAGNAARNTDFSPTYPASYDLDNIIAVAAIDSGDQLASFSNYGVRTVDLAAPGVSILSSVLGGGYASYNGTSMATPHVSGTVALVYGLHPDWSYGKVRDQIMATTWAAPALSGRTLTGGVVNAGAAVNAENPGPVPTPAQTPLPPTPVPPPVFYSFATVDLPIEGRVRGSYKDTWRNDTAVESIAERSSGGSPSTRIEQLEHAWKFFVPSGRPNIVFRVDAWSPPSPDNEKLAFEYSTDRKNWIAMFQLAQTSQSDNYQEYVLPDSVGGQDIFVRVRDLDRTPGSWKAADTVYVDHMYIVSTLR
jgi:subtilisin family serine protease